MNVIQPWNDALPIIANSIVKVVFEVFMVS
jgi:hypothetical protein